MAVSQIRKCVWLLDTIKSRPEGIPFEEISLRWMRASLNESRERLSKKSFHNLVSAISDIFGIEITCHRKGGYRYIIDHSTLFNEHDSISNILLSSISSLNIASDARFCREHIFFPETLFKSTLMVIIKSMYSANKLKLVMVQKSEEVQCGTTIGDGIMECIFEPYALHYNEEKGWMVYGNAKISKVSYANDRVPVGVEQMLPLGNIEEVIPLKETFKMPIDDILSNPHT